MRQGLFAAVACLVMVGCAASVDRSADESATSGESELKDGYRW